MVGGAAMAGAALGADIYYVDNTSFTLGKTGNQGANT